MLLNRSSVLESCPGTAVPSSPCSPSSSSSFKSSSSSSAAVTSKSSVLWSRLVLTLVLIISSLVVDMSAAHPVKHSAGIRGDTNGTVRPLDDLPQSDQPPRPNIEGSNHPSRWGQQSQNRTSFLRSKNDQYLVIHNNTVYGTTDSRPRSGRLRFLSHEMYLVISSYYSHQYLCLDHNGTLYLTKNVSPECYLHESTLDSEGSASQIYEFVHYKHLPKRYLGIDCEAETSNDTTADSVRFMYDPKAEMHSETPTTCLSKRQKEEARRKALKTRKMLKARWCWNLNRMEKKKDAYINNCTAKYCPKERSEKCVCDILKNMLNYTRRAKRKCLIAKVRSWVRKQKLTPNEDLIKDVAKRLLPGYQGISKRMQNLAKQKRRKSSQSAGEKPKSRTNRTRTANRPIKIKRLLEKIFKKELAPGSPKDSKPTGTSVGPLSKAFAEEIDKLIRPSPRHRRRHHGSRRSSNSRGRRARRSIKMNSFLFKGNITNSDKSSSSSPG